MDFFWEIVSITNVSLKSATRATEFLWKHRYVMLGVFAMIVKKKKLIIVLAVGGLVAPNQGFFPEYEEGLYIEGNTNMLVSRGVGNSILPFRINNRPEVILIELKKRPGFLRAAS